MFVPQCSRCRRWRVGTHTHHPQRAAIIIVSAAHRRRREAKIGFANGAGYKGNGIIGFRAIHSWRMRKQLVKGGVPRKIADSLQDFFCKIVGDGRAIVGDFNRMGCGCFGINRHGCHQS